MRRFYLGTHIPSQAWFDLGIPLFVSRTRLEGRRRLPRATAPWALDSAGYTALHNGGYRVTVEEYAEEVLRYDDEIGCLDWAACMDWMCEPSVLLGTGLTVRDHQARTIENFLALREHVGRLAAPVLQGWLAGQHEEHVAMYAAAGVDLWQERIVGVGSICRRNADYSIAMIVRPLAASGLRLHGFGVRSSALKTLAADLASADSMAWSAAGRRDKLATCGASHRNEANCRRYAVRWLAQQHDALNQLTLEVA